MRVLFTNHSLAVRAGTELYVRDVALALLARGHEPIAYSRQLGEVAAELRRAAVAVVDDLDRLERPPDLIHAQHHLEAMTAVVRFPATPALYVCHGWLPDEEAPPRHPRIRRYVAVDELVRRRLADECGIPTARTTVLLNFVDLDRFRPRPPLPARPARALVFSNRASEADVVPVVREACRASGVALDFVGLEAGGTVSNPEQVLGGYDVVFAKGRSALEAAAVGAAVVLCDADGLGPLVSSAALEGLRAFNFGMSLLGRPVTSEGVARALAGYDAEDAMEVSRRLRAEAGLDRAVERLIEIYREVVEEDRLATIPPEEEARAVAGYLRWGPLSGGDFFAHERVRSAVALAEAREGRDTAWREAAALVREVAWMRGTAAWRWRSRLLRHPGWKALYRWLFVRRRRARPAPEDVAPRS